MMRVLAVVLGIALFIVALLSYLREKDKGEPFQMLKPPPSAATPLNRYWPVPSFSLTERSGAEITMRDMQGKVWIADFFYSTCPGPCPMLSSRLSEIQKHIADEPDVRLVSISTDPEKDTPDVLKAYAQRFGATEKWLFLTGDKTAIYKLANQGFRLTVAEDPSAAEPISHSTKLALVDRDGFIRGFYDGIADQEKAPLLRDLKLLLQEKRGAPLPVPAL